MAIKCSLFGHAFGETTVEREREEQGSEVVITIREIETCSRCGETRVVSENKEVTTVETPEEVSLNDETDADASGDAASTGSAVDASGGAEIVDAEAGAPLSDVDPDGESPPEESVEQPIDAPSAAEDDGVILDGDADQSDREPGEWPEEPDDAASEPSADEDEPAESSAESADESAVWSEADPDLEAEHPTGGADPIPTGKFRCSECGFTAAIESSSLREGDYCPQCHQGTLLRELE